MLYPFPQEMVKNVQETVRTKMVDCVRTMMVDFVQNWPEYKRQLEMLRKKFYDKDRIMEILEELREPFWRGIVFNYGKRSTNSLSFVLIHKIS
jgi:hypothetical protein